MSDVQGFQPITMCFSKATLATGTTSTLSTTGTTTYAIRSKFYTKAALTNQATPTTDWATGNAFNVIAVNQGCVFMVGFDHSGNLKVIQGSVVGLDAIAGSGLFTVAASNFGGTAPAGSVAGTTGDFCPIGYLVIQNGTTGSNWTFGTNNWNATGITATAVDVCGWPDRPQVS